MRFGGDDDTGPPIEIELLRDDGFGTSEVSFGGANRRGGGDGGGGSKPWIIAGIGAAALLLGVVVFTGGDDSDDASAPSTTEAVPTTTDATTRTTRPRPSTIPTTTTAYVAPAAFATDPGWRVYLGDSERGEVTAFDPTTGVTSDVDAPGNVYLVGRDTAGEPAFLNFNDRFETAIPVGDGTAWILRDGELDRIDLGDLEVIEEVAVPPSFGAFGVQLIGTDAADRPLVLLQDFRVYSLSADGTVSRFSDDAIFTVVDRGRYASSPCDTSGSCTTRLHSGELTVDVDLAIRQVAFSPSGTHAAVFVQSDDGVEYRVIELATGAVVGSWDLTGGAVYSFYNFNQVMPGWSPDGRYFFLAFDRMLHAFDTVANGYVEFPGELPRPAGVLGVA